MEGERRDMEGHVRERPEEDSDAGGRHLVRGLLADQSRMADIIDRERCDEAKGDGRSQ